MISNLFGRNKLIISIGVTTGLFQNCDQSKSLNVRFMAKADIDQCALFAKKVGDVTV